MSKKNTNKKKFNMYEFMNKNRKKIVGCISAVIVLSMVFGMFAQLAYYFM